MAVSNNDNNSDPTEDSNCDSNTYTVHYHQTGEETIGSVIVKAVATVTDIPPTNLDPLYNTIDPQVLQTLYETINAFPNYENTGSLRFTFGGCVVTVYWSGMITVQPNTCTSNAE